MVVKKIQYIFKKQFVRNVITVASGTAIAQLISMLFSPIITRIYGPEAFGVLGVFTSIVAVLTPIAALTYPIAIVLPKEDKYAKQIAKLSIYIAAFISIIVALLFLFMGDEIIHVLQINDIKSYVFLIPLVMIFSAGIQILEQWLIRKKKFQAKARIAIFQSFIVNASKSGIGFLLSNASVLIIIAAMGYGVHFLLLAFLTGISVKSISLIKSTETDNKFLDLKRVSKKYRDFPIYRAPEVLINSISQNLPIFVLSSFFGPASVGFYAIGKKVLEIPIQLIGNSVGDVFYPRIVDAAHQKENLSQIIIKATLILAAIGLIPFGIIIIFGPMLFSFVFGNEWITAGIYARWIGLWSFFMFTNKPSMKTLAVIGAQKFHLIFTISNIILRLGALLVGGYYFGNDLVAIALYCIVGAILNIMLIIITIGKSKKYNMELI